MSTLKMNDPRVTAYALDELEGDEKKQFEAELAQDPALREEVKQLRHLKLVLSDELRKEPSPELSAEQREKISGRSRRFGAPLRWTFGVGLTGAVAAALALWLPTAERANTPVDIFANVKAPKTEAAADSAAPAQPQGDRIAHAASESSTQARKTLTPFASNGAGALRSDPIGKGTLGRGTVGRLAEVSRNAGARAQFPKDDERDFAHSKRRPPTLLAMDKKSRSVQPGPSKPPKFLDTRSVRTEESRAVAEPEAGTTGTGFPADEADTVFNTEAYDRVEDNAFIGVGEDPRSTFSIDVDTASYSNVRRFLIGGQLPPKDAARIEELVNYFSYSYAPPTDGKPFAVHTEVTQAPWNKEHRLVRIGLKGKEIVWDKRPASNLVFLIDVSGSMNGPTRLPLVIESLKLLVEQLGKKDRIAIVVYSGASGLVLPSTSGGDKTKVLAALDALHAGGSTNGGAGIELAYKTATEHFIKGGSNRVILATDGDFNVGVSSQGDLIRLIEEKRKSGVFLSVLGYGMGNVKDSTLEKLADKGNGAYAYIDTLTEAKKVMVKEIGGTLFTIAKDVKIQVEFNPSRVAAYRLIGYENRVLAHQDFNDDTKDAGDIGAGHTVTALYEVVPAGKSVATPGIDKLKYQAEKPLTAAAGTGELMTVKLRYKKPDEDKSALLEVPVTDGRENIAAASGDLRFAAAVASFGMLLRDSKWKGTSSFDDVMDLASAATGHDDLRIEFLDLVRRAKQIATPPKPRK